MVLYNLIECRRRYDVNNAVPLLVEKVRVNIFLNQFKLLYKIFSQILRRNECKISNEFDFFRCLSNYKLHWVASKVNINRFIVHSLCTRPNVVYTSINIGKSQLHSLNLNIYILGVLTEKPYSKSLEHNVVYIPIITLCHATSHDFK